MEEVEVQVQLQQIANGVCDLLQCHQVILWLNCVDRELSHPLLRTFERSYQRYVSSSNGTNSINSSDNALLQDTRVQALCDIVLQSASFHYLEASHTLATLPACTSLLAIPLEASAGMLGVLLCVSEDIQHASHLLAQAQSAIVQRIEHLLTLPYAKQGVITLPVQYPQAFFAIIKHELRVPLAAIKGYAGLLQAYDGADTSDSQAIMMTAERRRHYATSILEQSRHVEMLMQDVLDISQLQAGHLALRCEACDIGVLCQQVTQFMQEQTEQQQSAAYTFHCQLETPVSRIWADPQRMQQIITNLIENAVKYSPKGGCVDILVSSRFVRYAVDSYQEWAKLLPQSRKLSGRLMTCITIRDRGAGIPHQQQATLFSLFARATRPETEHIHGMGIGLYLTRVLVQAMQGSIILQSREGEGTSITLAFPALMNEESWPVAPTRDATTYRDIVH